jgi:RNA polymerase sigma-70 factor (ECF subfamily)
MTYACVSLAPAAAGSLLSSDDEVRRSVDRDVAARPESPAMNSDDELLARIALADEAAFRCLVERHIDRSYGLALRILGNAADAEDVVQDTLLKVWTHRGRWEAGRAKFSTWLYRVVMNRCIDLRRQPRGEDVDSIAEPVDGHPDAVTTLHRTEVTDLLETAMTKVPEQQRLALILSYHQELSNSEIAEVMETTVPAVESLLKRGRQRLRELLRRSESDIRQAFADD